MWHIVTGDIPPTAIRPRAKVTMSETTSQPQLLRLTAQIAAAHASHNHVTSEALLRLIENVYGALADSGKTVMAEAKPQPAVPVKRSVFPSHIVCLEDGKKLKMLKRHLMTAFKLTPSQYREKWGLPASYPMVAPSYTAQRSVLAKQFGLGRKPALEPAVPEPVAPPAARFRRSRLPK